MVEKSTVRKCTCPKMHHSPLSVIKMQSIKLLILDAPNNTTIFQTKLLCSVRTHTRKKKVKVKLNETTLI